MNIEAQKTWVRKHPIWTVFGVLFLIGWISSLGEDKTPVQPVTEKVTQESAPTPVTLEDKIKELTKKSGSTHVTFVSFDDKTDRTTAFIKLNVTEFLSAKYFYKDTGKLMGEVAQAAFSARPDITGVNIWYMGDTKDKYGNVSNNVLVSYAMSRKTYEKINWGNFDSGNLCDFLKSETTASGGNDVCAIRANIQ